MKWYNRHVVAVYKELAAFDAEGLFIADGTYLFVPDNRVTRLATDLLFDEHNHPVNETGTSNDQGPAGSLPLATLLQSGAAFALRRGRQRFVVAGVRVLRTSESEATVTALAASGRSSPPWVPV